MANPDKHLVVLIPIILFSEFQDWLTNHGLAIDKAPYRVLEDDPNLYRVTITETQRELLERVNLSRKNPGI